MSVSSFVKRSLVEIDERPFKLLRKIDNEAWQLEDQRTGKIREENIKTLLKDYANGTLVFINDTEAHSSREQALAERKRNNVTVLEVDEKQLARMRMIRAYVKAVDNLPTSEKLFKPVISEVWAKLGSQGTPPNWITVSRWRRKYILHGNDAYSVLPRNYRKGNRKARYTAEVIRIVKQAIENVYLTRERNTVQDTLDSAIVHVERENKLLPTSMQLALPTRRMLQTLINEIDQFDRYAARYGQQAAIRKFRAVLHMNVTQHPLECAEIDHTKLDLIVVDEESGLPLGRPWVTVCIDRHTRCVLGVYVGFEPCSYLSVSRCLKHAFKPKVDLKDMHPEITNEWCAFGVMQRLIVDNGFEFHSDSLEKVCFLFGIDLQFTPRKTPWWKGIVERFIGTMNRGVAHGTPGTTFANIFEKDDYDPLKNAVITLGQLKLILNKWIVDVYHQKPHRSIDNMPPAIKWSSGINIEEINLPENLENLDAVLGATAERVLTHKGIEYEKLFFNSSELASLRRRLGDRLKVDIRVDEGNLGRIFVIAPDSSDVIEVPCLDRAYADGLSLWQHRVCKRYANLYLDMGSNANAWRHAKEHIREIIQQEVLGHKKRTNSKAKRFMGEASVVESSPPAASAYQAEAPLNPLLPTENFNTYEAVPMLVAKKFKALIEIR